MAARIKAIIKPALIEWARDSAGLTRADLAQKLGIEESRIAAWESDKSEDAPSIPQLREIAAICKRPLAVFYLPEPPKNFQAMRDLRRLPGSGIRRFSPELQIELRIANQRRELALEMASELGQQLPAFTLEANVGEDPDTVGERIRAVFGITPGLQSKWKGSDGRVAFRAWRTRIEESGVLVFQTTTVESEEASGFAIYADVLPVAVVNRKDTVTRRTFSMLHELAHLMIHESGVSDLETDAKRPPQDQLIEVFCNSVAAAALMPKAMVLDDVRVKSHPGRATDWSDSEIQDLASTFGVSREAIVRRLLTFGRTTEAFYKAKRAQYLAEYLARKEREKANKDPRPRNMPIEVLSNVGGPLVRMVLGGYHQERITLSDVSGYLGLKVKHIPKLEYEAGLR